MCFAPGIEGRNARAAFFLSDSQAVPGGMPGDLPLDIVELSDLLKGFPCDCRAAAFPDIMECPTQVGLAGRFAHADGSRCIGFIQVPEPGVGIRLENTREGRQMGLGIDPLAIGREPVGNGGRIAATPGAGIKNLDGRIIGMKQVCPNDILTDQCRQGMQDCNGLTTPVDQG